MTAWFADSHVHFHKCFEEGKFFDTCFGVVAKNLSKSTGNGILFFTEGKNDNYFHELLSKKRIKSSVNKEIEYIVSETEDKSAIEVKMTNGGMRIIIVPGFQIVTKENLEVLALGTKKRIIDGAPIEETISNVINFGGIPVLPWGFGKWYGRRGEIINELIDKNISPLFLGDNGGRSNLLPYPSQFSTALKKGIKILPGSDPLPFPKEVKRPMSYGFRFNASINISRPWLDIKNALLNPELKMETFGRLTSPISFFKTQITLQFKKGGNK